MSEAAPAGFFTSAFRRNVSDCRIRVSAFP